MAAEHGASAAFNPLKEDVVAEVFKATNNQGADVVYDAAGIQATLDLAIKALRPRGNLMNIALWSQPASIHMNNVLFKEITITGAFLSLGVARRVARTDVSTGIIGYDRVHGEVVEALGQGKFTGLEKFITRKIGLNDVVDKGIVALDNEKDTQSKCDV